MKMRSKRLVRVCPGCIKTPDCPRTGAKNLESSAAMTIWKLRRRCLGSHKPPILPENRRLNGNFCGHQFTEIPLLVVGGVVSRQRERCGDTSDVEKIVIEQCFVHILGLADKDALRCAALVRASEACEVSKQLHNESGRQLILEFVDELLAV